MSGGRAVLVVDLGFGDAGKGLVTDALTRALGAHTVVRFNGGAQAGHNVVTPDGRHHTFAQIGAGSFVPGVRTYLSRHVVVHPAALLIEAERLAAAGVPDVLDRVTVSPRAPVITPFHQAAGRLRELGRGDARHGSCGVGFGEAVADLWAGEEVIRMGDLGGGPALRRAVARVQARKRAELDGVLRDLPPSPAAEAERRVLEDPAIPGAWLDALAPLVARGVVAADEAAAAGLRGPGTIVLEGAQGVLLDEWRGFHPHTTWSTCTFDNALEVLREAGHDGEVLRLGVLRTFATRHGHGPFPTEERGLGAALAEAHNAAGPWQGPFRAGWPDLVLARYAIEVAGGIDALALTHLDALRRLPDWRVCRAYRAGAVPVDGRLFESGPGGLLVRLRPGPARDLAYQASLTRALGAVEPVCESARLGEGTARAERYVERMEEALGTRVLVAASGPSARDVRLVAPLLRRLREAGDENP